MSKEQVKKIEQAKLLREFPLKENITLLLYSGNFAGFKSTINYYFLNNRLKEVKLHFNPKFLMDNSADSTAQIQTYKKIKEFMVKEYGQGETIGRETNIWNYHAKWETSTSEIELVLEPKYSVFLVKLDFWSKNLK